MKGMNQVVPNCSPVILTAEEEKEQSPPRTVATNKEGVKLLELFAGSDIFAHHEE